MVSDWQGAALLLVSHPEPCDELTGSCLGKNPILATLEHRQKLHRDGCSITPCLHNHTSISLTTKSYFKTNSMALMFIHFPFHIASLGCTEDVTNIQQLFDVSTTWC